MKPRNTQTQPLVAHIYGTVHVCCVCMHVLGSQVEGVESLVFIVM